MDRLAKFWSLTRREKEVLCEASILLSLCNICVKAIAFRHIDRFLRSRWNHGNQGTIDYEQESRLVQRSVSRAANVLPWKSRCLTQSIAEFIMLRRRGIPAVIYAGVRFSGESSLDAHTWVRIGLEDNDKSAENSGFVTVIKIGSLADDRACKH
jgi:hypothetical protein